MPDIVHPPGSILCRNISLRERNVPKLWTMKDTEYLKIVKTYAESKEALDEAFAAAWYKLTSRDMGPVTRCAGTDVPPAQEFQLPLPEASTPRLDRRVLKKVTRAIEGAITTIDADILEPDVFHGKSSYSALFVNLAFQCMAGFRSTDYLGGCNGARIRFPPQSEWVNNAGMDKVTSLAMVGVPYTDSTFVTRGVVSWNPVETCNLGARWRIRGVVN